MRVEVIQTRILEPPKDDLLGAITDSLKAIPEGSLLCIASKVVSIDEGRCLPVDEVQDPDKLIEQESIKYLDPKEISQKWKLTVRDSLLLPQAGIDASNANGHYILLPEDPMSSATHLRHLLMRHYALEQLGLVVTDSRVLPLRRGTVGVALGWSGFEPLTDYRGTPDLFGRAFEVSERNVADGLASAAVLAMGEGKEQTPLALISEVDFVQFKDKSDADIRVMPEGDLYAPIFTKLPWKDGGKYV
jgi:dihydrofolate synthase / folylpolyglutamate synthase